MANTTFSGPVRSENGFTVVSKNATTGAFTTSFTYDGSGMQVAPVTLSDADTTLTAATHGGRVVVVILPVEETDEVGVLFKGP